MKLFPAEFYDCSHNERTRIHFARDFVIEEMGLAIRDGYGWAFLHAAPFIQLICSGHYHGSNEPLSDGTVTAPNGTIYAGAPLFISHRGEAHAGLRMERKKGTLWAPLPVQWKGTMRIVDRWKDGGILEFNVAAPEFVRRAPQTTLF